MHCRQNCWNYAAFNTDNFTVLTLSKTASIQDTSKTLLSTEKCSECLSAHVICSLKLLLGDNFVQAYTAEKKLSHMISPVRLLTKKLFSASDEGFKIASRIAAQTRKCHGILICSQVAGYCSSSIICGQLACRHCRVTHACRVRRAPWICHSVRKQLNRFPY